MVSDLQRTQEIRDLKGELGTLEGDARDRQEGIGIIFQMTSPSRIKRTIFSMQDGEPRDVPRYIAERALSKKENGAFMFTSHGFECDCGNCTPSVRAPEYKLGTVKCFLHADSSDKAILEIIGLSANPCPKKTLRDQYSKIQHAENRHPREWKAYQHYLAEEKEAAAIERQEQQTNAMLAMAGRAAEAPVKAEQLKPCPECNYQGTAKQLRGHKMGAHKKVEAATAS